LLESQTAKIQVSTSADTTNPFNKGEEGAWPTATGKVERRMPGGAMVDEGTGGWSRSEIHVNAELKRLADEINGMSDCVNRLKVEVATLKTKASIWGGIVGAGVAIAVKYLLG
jgi:hypothetical protein